MGITFWIMFCYADIKVVDVFWGFVPQLNADEVGVGMSLMGCIIMPHNLYLQSSLVMTRNIESCNKKETKKAAKYFRIETFIIVIASFIINMAVIGAFSGISDIRDSADSFISAANVIQENLGNFCKVIFGIGLFASGMSSTATGALTGQYTMNGYVKWKINKYVRICVTRLVALAPCLLIVGYADLTSANFLLNTFQIIQLPFVLIPLARFIGNRRIMNDLTFVGFKYWFILITAVMLLALNTWNVIQPILDLGLDQWYTWMILLVFSLYLGFIGYLFYLVLDISKFKQLYYSIVKTGQNTRRPSAVGFIEDNFEETESCNGNEADVQKKIDSVIDIHKSAEALLKKETINADNEKGENPSEAHSMNKGMCDETIDFEDTKK